MDKATDIRRTRATGAFFAKIASAAKAEGDEKQSSFFEARAKFNEESARRKEQR